MLQGGAGCQQHHGGGTLLIVSGEEEPITGQVEVLNSLFHITCLKTAGAIKTRMLSAQPEAGMILGNQEKFSN